MNITNYLIILWVILSLFRSLSIFELPTDIRLCLIFHSNVIDVDQRKMVCMVVPIDFVSSSFMDLYNEHFTTHMYDSITENEQNKRQMRLKSLRLQMVYYLEKFFLIQLRHFNRFFFFTNLWPSPK